MGESSFVGYDRGLPSAVLSDGVLTVPLWAVSTLAISESYQLPPMGSTGFRAVSQVHDDTITLSAALVGPERFAWKLGLEQLAEASKRGTALGTFTGGRVGGLILVTSMTIRTDIQVQSMSFTANAAKREVLDVQLTLAYLPLPSLLGKLLDVASLGVGALHDVTGR
jgi:hypothetical protein